MADREWTAKSRGNKLGYSIFLFFLKHFGLGFAYANLTYVVPHFMLFAPTQTKALWFYYRTIWGKSRLQTIGCIYKHFFRFGQCLIDKAAIQCGLKDRFTFQFENYDNFLQLLDSGRGAIIIGAHVGAWQMGGTFFGDYAKKMHIVMVDEEYEFVKQYMEESDKTYSIIPVNKTDEIETALRIKRALNAGETVCLQGDRYMNRERVLTAKFLGYDANFPEGPFRLAAKLRVPVAFYFATRQNRGYKFAFTTVDTQVDGAKITEKQLLAQYIAALEKVVKTAPQQWFNLYQFWNVFSEK